MTPLLAPEGALCRLHPEEVTRTLCDRCGGFMCRDCSARFVEERCPTCRPKYGPSELRERRLQRIRKHVALRCEVCGMESPTLLRVQPVPWLLALAAPLILVGSLIFPCLWLIVIPNETAFCPGCERTDELEPLLETNVSPPKGWDVLVAEHEQVRRANRTRIGTGLALTVVLLLSWLVLTWFPSRLR